jgi:hypothetical protein
MDPGVRTPIIDQFRRGEVPRDLKLVAARGGLVPRALEALALLAMLTEDGDPEVATVSKATLDSLPKAPLSAYLARTEISSELRLFFERRGIAPAASPDPAAAAPLLESLGDTGDAEHADEEATELRVLSSLPIVERMKLAMKGTREHRAQLIRDSNRLVASAVLSSPKLTETEVESFAKMANVTEEVLRVIASNRTWTKNYGVVLGLTKNPKTPAGISMHLLQRLNEKDTKMLAVDRNVPEALRLAARKMMVKKLK